MPTTQELRDAWSPACVERHRSGLLAALKALDAIMKKYNYKPLSGQTWGYNCRRITNGSGYSLHSYRSDETFKFWTGVPVELGIAIDINSKANPYGSKLVTNMPRAMVEEICGLRTNTGRQVWNWGGYYSGNKDAMHFEIFCYPADIRSGIKNAPVVTQPKPEPEKPKEEDMDYIVEVTDDNSPVYYFVSPSQYTTIGNMDELKALQVAFQTKQMGSFAFQMITRSRTLKPR